MKEELISFKTAKLAEQKGFKEHCNYCYNEKGTLIQIGNYNGVEDSYFPSFSAPTQSFLQKWLRETHHLNIVVSPSHFMYDPCKILYRSQIFAGLNEPIFDDFETYEEALEKGIYEALNMI